MGFDVLNLITEEIPSFLLEADSPQRKRSNSMNLPSYVPTKIEHSQLASSQNKGPSAQENSLAKKDRPSLRRTKTTIKDWSETHKSTIKTNK